MERRDENRSIWTGRLQLRMFKDVQGDPLERQLAKGPAPSTITTAAALTSRNQLSDLCEGRSYMAPPLPSCHAQPTAIAACMAEMGEVKGYGKKDLLRRSSCLCEPLCQPVSSKGHVHACL